MNIQTKLTLALLAFAPICSAALADPPVATINPEALKGITITTPGAVAKALRPTPTPAPTGPCLAELSLDRFEITPSADRATYNISITIGNIGSEAAIGERDVLGISLETTTASRARNYFAQMASIDVIHPGTSRNFTGFIAARELNRTMRDFTARIDRGPDGPRCAYDARRTNDGLGISVTRMHEWLDAGNPSYVRTR